VAVRVGGSRWTDAGIGGVAPGPPRKTLGRPRRGPRRETATDATAFFKEGLAIPSTNPDGRNRSAALTRSVTGSHRRYSKDQAELLRRAAILVRLTGVPVSPDHSGERLGSRPPSRVGLLALRRAMRSAGAGRRPARVDSKMARSSESTVDELRHRTAGVPAYAPVRPGSPRVGGDAPGPPSPRCRFPFGRPGPDRHVVHCADDQAVASARRDCCGRSARRLLVEPAFGSRRH
jgi:hypothetical protein